MNIIYLQGGPKDLSKHVWNGKPPNPLYVAEMEDRTDFTGNEEVAVSLAPCVKHAYHMVGGYTQQGNDIYTYSYAGLVNRIVL